MVNTPGRKVAIYARISRDKTGAGLGVDRQVGDCTDLAERNGWTIAHPPFTDNDLSAYSGKPRPAYRRLLAAIEAGTVDVVVCWHSDRLHRAPVELEEWINTCEPRGVEVHTVKAGPIDLATPSGRMVARQLGAVARYESEHRAERIAASRTQIARNGGYLGGSRPFGYEADGTTLRPDEARLIEAGTRTILEGGSLRSVVRAWNASGTVTTKAGRTWDPIAVRDVLTRARNAGLVRHRRQVIGQATWPAIVSEDAWRGVTAILTNPERRTSPGNKTRWLGSGLYRCGIEGCGGPMVVGTTGQGQNPSYICRGYQGRPGGRHVTRQAPTLDEFVSRLIIARLSMPDAVGVFTRDEPAVDTTALRADLAAIDAQRAELAERFGRGEITVAMLDAANRPLLERQQALESALGSAATHSPVVDLVEQEDVGEAWEATDLDIRRAVLAELMTVTVLPAPRGRRPGGGYFDPSSVRIEWNNGAEA